MNGFFDKIQRFMIGRNGLDKLTGFLFAIYATLVFVSFFVIRFPIAHIVVYALEFILMLIIVFRTLSRNIYKRQKENRNFLRFSTAVKEFFTRQKNKIRDRKTHRYVKCKNCRAHLRVKNIKGKHTVRCPKCRNTFDVRILL